MDNMTIYNAVRSVPKEAQKAFNNGKFSGTDINPMWRIKVLTEQFGPCGLGWYIDNTVFEDKVVAGETITICQLDLYVKYGDEWSRPIHGVGGNRTATTRVRDGKEYKDVSDEAEKMAYTDAISVACKALGIGADVYYDKDKTKYTAYEVPADPAPKTASRKASAPAAEPERKVCDKVTYDAYVQKEANGERLRSGKTAKQGWIDTFKPTEAEIAAFDQEVRRAFLEDING